VLWRIARRLLPLMLIAGIAVVLLAPRRQLPTAARQLRRDMQVEVHQAQQSVARFEERPAAMIDPSALPDGVLASQHLGVRVWWITAPTLQEMVDRLAVVLGEHLQESDDLHISYNGMQRSRDDKAKLKLFGPPEQWTVLRFEYSALVILRDRSPAEDPDDAPAT
jgi:hypothetical protein